MTIESEVETNLGDDEYIDSGVEAEDGDEDQSEEYLEDGEEGDEPEAEEEETEEVEVSGKKYKLPRSLKDNLMMQQDYTRKTTELSESRKAFEAERAQRIAAVEEMQEDYGRVHALKSQVAEFEKINWSNLSAIDPAEAQALWMTYQQVKDGLSNAENDLKTKTEGRLRDQRENLAKAMQETGRVLSREIKGWSAELSGKLAEFAETYGVPRSELFETPDPRIWKLLNDAYQGRQTQTKQKATERQQRVQQVQPAKSVQGRPIPPTGLSDRLSAAEWARRRNAQLAKRR